MATPSGHVYCKECIVEFLLTKTQELKRQREAFEEQEKNKGVYCTRGRAGEEQRCVYTRITGALYYGYTSVLWLSSTRYVGARTYLVRDKMCTGILEVLGTQQFFSSSSSSSSYTSIGRYRTRHRKVPTESNIPGYLQYDGHCCSHVSSSPLSSPWPLKETRYIVLVLFYLVRGHETGSFTSGVVLYRYTLQTIFLRICWEMLVKG